MYYLDRLIESGEFRFERLSLQDIDNAAVIKNRGSVLEDEEVCLFHRDVTSGGVYLDRVHELVSDGMASGRATPIVRFADGEYAFYANNLHCNGLYRQAESVEAIKKAIPIHVEAIRVLNRQGRMAPLIFRGNTQKRKKSVFSFLHKTRGADSALQFVEFLSSHQIPLRDDNYMPFYIIYAYLTSRRFCEAVDRKKICLITSECDMDLCQQWFGRFSSRPEITFVDIPDAYVATQWSGIRETVFSRIPPETHLCLVGAGIGALLVCVDVARAFSLPAIDAGHVLNMMNGREDKSNGLRLYTFHKPGV